MKGKVSKMKVYAIVEDGLVMSALFASYEMAQQYANDLNSDSEDFGYGGAEYGVAELEVME